MAPLNTYIIYFSLSLLTLFILVYFWKKWRSEKIKKFSTNDLAIDQIEIKYQQIKISVTRLD